MTKRRGVLRGVKAWFRCLRCVKGHSFRDCRAVCSLCKGGHHQLLCEQVTSDKHPITPPCNIDVVSCVNAVTGVSSRVMLQTTSVLVHGKCGVSEAVILFDTGSDKSYISKPWWVKLDQSGLGLSVCPMQPLVVVRPAMQNIDICTMSL